MSDKELIGLRIKELRKHHGENQDVFGEKIGSSRSMISQIEGGLCGTSPEILKEIALKYHVNLNWLLTGEGEKFKITNIPNQTSNETSTGMIDTFKKELAFLHDQLKEKDFVIRALLGDKGNFPKRNQETRIVPMYDYSVTMPVTLTAC